MVSKTLSSHFLTAMDALCLTISTIRLKSIKSSLFFIRFNFKLLFPMLNMQLTSLTKMQDFIFINVIFHLKGFCLRITEY